MSEDSKLIKTVIKTGHSLAVVVPAPFAKQVGLRSGDKVRVQIKQELGQITYTFLNTRQLPLTYG